MIGRPNAPKEERRPSMFVELMEKIAPTFWFEDEDNSGIQIDCGKKKIRRVLVCLEINDDIIEEAKKKKVDMILTHHPLLFHPINSISQNTPVGRYVLALIKAGIGVYSSHLAFDTAPMGNNMYLAKLLRLKDVAVPEDLNDEDDDYDDDLADDLDDEMDDDLDDEMDDELDDPILRVSFDGRDPVYYEVDNEYEDQFEYDVDEVGNIGYLPKAMNFKQFCTYVERCLDLPKNYIRCVDGGKDKIEKIAFCTGAGGDYIYRAVELGCDAYVTGDLKLHEAQYAKAMGLTVIDAGHYGTEKIFTENMAAQLREAAEEAGEKLEVIEAESNTNPYTL